jgi:hypothetical protein
MFSISQPFSRQTRVATFALLALCVQVAGPLAHARAQKTPPPRGAELITAAQMRDYLSFIASNDLEGRDTPSRGLDIAARFLATQLSRFGLEPAGDDGYFQRMSMTRRRIEPAGSRVTLGERSFAFGDDFIASAAGTATGPMVYVGHGYVVKAKSIDAYKGVDVTGKILIANAGMPDGVTRADTRGEAGAAWHSPATYAAAHGALAVVLIPDFAGLSGWARSRQGAVERGTVSVDKLASTRQGPVPVITASAGLVSALFEGERLRAAEIFERAHAHKGGDTYDLSTDKRLAITVAANNETLSTQNVVAIWRGSDPKLKDEYVAVGAHYDHVGVNTTGSDKIFNGADDDGSGTTALLAMAEALARGQVKTKRSVLFVWHAGEERGLLGSRFFTQFPIVPIDRIVAHLNIDMIGRSRQAGDTTAANSNLTGPSEVYVIGSKMMSTDLGELSERVNKGYLDLSFNYKYDDPDDPNRFFFRSDHYNYAKKGIPIIFYFSGVHEDYHRVSDEVSKIDFAKMEKVTRTVYATLLALTDAPARPRVDKSLPAQLTEE